LIREGDKIMAVRKAEATWNGTLKEGTGTMKLGSGAFEGPFSFSTRFEEEPGTNPEELIGAAYAGCYSMALSADLEGNGTPATSVSTSGKVHLTPAEGGGVEISKIVLTVSATVAGIDEAKFNEIVEGTREGCPIGKLLKGGTATLEINATLQS
jgi:lipoyl-dependent peroxiredoxin